MTHKSRRRARNKRFARAIEAEKVPLKTFEFQTNTKTVKIEASNLQAARILFQEAYGTWPEDNLS